MKNKNLMMGLGFAAFSMSMQAQTTLVSLGFEDGDSKYHTAGSLSGLGTYGDWVNPKDGDEWNEKCKEEPKSGEYCLFANNSRGTNGQNWDRGFKIGNLTLKENTPYRVSFWLKVDESTFNDPESGDSKGTGLRAWLSKGIENYDKSLCTASGANYGIEKDGGFGEGWQRFSFVSYYTTADVMNKYVNENQSWVGNAVYPESLGGDGTKKYKDVYENKIPEQFFAVINMHSPVSYFLDDIKIEEGVTFNAATFNEGIIRLDFGYSTNMADLANANRGTVSLPVSCVKVVVDGTEVTPHLVEGKADGFVYLFFDEGTDFTGKDVKVSFTPAADCPIKYAGDKRPSSDTETEMTILGFENEVVYATDEQFDVLSSEEQAPEMVSVTPENNSFNLTSEKFKQIVVKFNKEINVDGADVAYSYKDNFDEHNIPLDPKDYTVGEDPTTLVIKVPELSNGEYVFTIGGVASTAGVYADDDDVITLTYEVGKSQYTEESKTIYASDFDNDMTDGVPRGWYTINEAGVHQYGFNDEARTSQYNYSYSGQPGGGGTRLFEGFSGDFTKALYWGSRGTNEGVCTYGQLVADYIDPKTGELMEDTPEDIRETALKLSPRKYQISFLMAAWKNTPTFTFTLEDLEGNVYAKFANYTATPNVNGEKVKVSGAVKCQADFTVEKEGFYILKFTAAEAQWQEFLLANLKLITMPAKSAYYTGRLNKALDDADEYVKSLADNSDLDGDIKNNLVALLARVNAQAGDITSPSEVEALIDEINAAVDVLKTRGENITKFRNASNELFGAAEDLKVEETGKYKNSTYGKEVIALNEKYQTVDPAKLPNDELIEVTPKLEAAAKYAANIHAAVDALTWGATKAGIIADKFGIANEKVDAVKNASSDDAKAISAVNDEIAYALLSKLANKESIEELKEDVFNTAIVSEDPEAENPNPVEFKGIDLSSYVRNSHLYRVNGVDGVPGWTITSGVEDKDLSLGFNTNPSDENPVVDAQISSYGNNTYDMTQTIEGLPAGYYTLCIQTRTPYVTKEIDEVPYTYYYNAQDENGTWDKFIYAKGDEGSEGVAPYAGASGLVTTFVKDIKVTEGKLVIGAKENYVSGKAVKHEDGTAQDFWTGTSYVDYVNIYFVAPIEDYDYVRAMTGVESVNVADATVADIYSVGGVRQSKLAKGINIVKYSDGSVRRIYVK